MLKEKNGKSASLFSPYSNTNKYNAYQEIPFSLYSPVLPKIRQPLDKTDGFSQRYRVKKLASKTIEGHFADLHGRYTTKENLHQSIFKLKAKKTQNTTNKSELELFFEQKTRSRQKALQSLNEQYLKEVLSQLQGKTEVQTEGESSRQQKIICEYNIIYQYRAESIPLDFFQ